VRRWWASLKDGDRIALIGLAVALIAAVPSYLALRSESGDSPGTAVGNSAATTSPAPTVTSTTGSSEPTSGSHSEPTSRWHDRISLPAGLDADLDTVPPKVNAGTNSDIQNYHSIGQEDAALTRASWAKGLSKWGGGSAPSYEDCKTSTSVEPVDQIYPLKVGMRACLMTTDDRIVSVRVSRIDASQRITLDVMVWEVPG
jgi:hypothetical protein